MADPQSSPRITCLSVAMLAVLAGAVVIDLAFGVVGPKADSWTAIGAAVVAVAGVFIVARHVQNFLWALLAALLMSVHPLVRHADPANVLPWLAEAGVLAIWAAVAIGWYLVFLPRFAWRVWPVVAPGSMLGVGLIWHANPQAGLLAACLAALGTLGAVILGWRLRRIVQADLPSALNILAGLVLALAVLPVGIYVGQFVDLSETNESIWKSLADTIALYRDGPATGFTYEGIDVWCWPTVWLVGPLLAWSSWRTLRRGWKNWTRHRPPASWLLSLFSILLLVGLVPKPGVAPLVLIGWQVLMGTFLLADLARGFVEHLVLLPPDQREAEESPVVEHAKPQESGWAGG